MKVGNGGGFRAGRIKMAQPAKMPRPSKIHPAAQPRVRLPTGEVNTSQADPAPWLPGVGKI